MLVLRRQKASKLNAFGLKTVPRGRFFLCLQDKPVIGRADAAPLPHDGLQCRVAGQYAVHKFADAAVRKVVRNMRQPGVPGTELPGDGKRLFKAQVGCMGLYPQSVYYQMFQHAAPLLHKAYGILRHKAAVRQVGNAVADAAAGFRKQPAAVGQFSVQQRHGNDFQPFDLQRMCGRKSGAVHQIKLGFAAAKLHRPENVVECLADMGDGACICIDRKPVSLRLQAPGICGVAVRRLGMAEAAQVVQPVQVVGMRMRKQHGIKAFDAVADRLQAEFRTGIDDKLRGFTDKRAAPVTLVLPAAGTADAACAADNRHSVAGASAHKNHFHAPSVSEPARKVQSCRRTVAPCTGSRLLTPAQHTVIIDLFGNVVSGQVE